LNDVNALSNDAVVSSSINICINVFK